MAKYTKKTNAGTDEDFNLVVKMRESGFSISEISKATGWAKNTIYNWVQFKTRPEYMDWMNKSKAKSLAKKTSEATEVPETKSIIQHLASIDESLKLLVEMWK